MKSSEFSRRHGIVDFEAEDQLESLVFMRKRLSTFVADRELNPTRRTDLGNIRKDVVVLFDRRVSRVKLWRARCRVAVAISARVSLEKLRGPRG